MGCREPIAPNIDRNQAPETWITAAPFDTITLRDEFERPIENPRPGTIPVRFHVYWAGADHDGAVTGFYWAVVETLPRPPVGSPILPSLPGPKPRDYRYTTNTDSFFVFTVAEDIPDRQHAFFIYAVDNLGKPDPTPARFIFNAQDRFPPIPIFDECKCVGDFHDQLPGGGVQKREITKHITDIDLRTTLPRDTCPSNSALYFKWHGEPTIPQTTVIGYRYKLDETNFNVVGPEVTSAAYNTKVGADSFPPATGTKIFVLRAVDQAFGSRDSTRRFQYNFSPDTWFSGPDINSPDLQTRPNGERYVLQASLAAGGIRGSLLHAESTVTMPALRPQRITIGDFRDEGSQKATFFEIWEDTVFVRQEGDTVHMNSWIVLHGGGFDPDSKYSVNVTELAHELDDFPGGPVLVPGPLNGSPIGFRSQIVTALTPGGFPSRTGKSNLYPLWDPNSVFFIRSIGGYHPVFQAGRAFAAMYAVDGDNSEDRRIEDPRALVLRIESGTALPEEVALRSKVLTFEVNRSPYLVEDSPLLRPSLDPNNVTTFTSQLWDLRLVATDEDPFEPGKAPGAPSPTVTLRRKIAIYGRDVFGGAFEYVDPHPYLNETNINILVPNGLAPGPCTLEVELCDCDKCEDFAGSGRCRTYRISVDYQPATPTTTSMDSSRPGSGATPR